jgi:caffeoyl-CoA O-methyltransferase
MHFIDPALERYCETHTESEPEILNQLARETHLKTTMPRMLSGHLQGRLLSLLSKLIQPRCILEIGTFTGYSAICLAEGLTSDGKIITIDINDETSAMAKKYFTASEFSSQIDFRIGNALEIIPTIDETLDLIFMDADKNNYVNYYEMVLPRMRQGGLLIADNVLWSGRILQDESKMDPDTLTLRKLASLAHTDPRVEPVLLPVRDGLLVMRKK